MIGDIDTLAEGRIETREGLTTQMSDEELCKLADSWISEAKPLRDKMKRKQDKNYDYYLGEQLNEKDLKDINEFTSLIKENRIFSSLETLVPNATYETPSPVVTIPLGDEEDDAKTADIRLSARFLEEILIAIAQDNKMSWKAKDFLRYNQLYYLGVWKFGYDAPKEGESYGKIWVENIRPQRILIPPYACSDYVIEHHIETLEEIITMFPKKKAEVEKEYLQKQKENNLGSKIGFFEVTTPKYKFWKLGKIILKREDNPHYDFKNPKKNVWEKPRIDYIFSNIWTMGINQYSQTTLVEQALTLQDSLNKRKRQISDNADQANGVLIGYENSGITKAEQSAVSRARKTPGGGEVFLEKATQGSLQEFGGKQIAPFVVEDMYDTRNSIDNVFGTHAVTRGERTPGEKTFGESSLLKEGDRTRIGELVEMLENAFEDLYNCFAQLIVKHFDKDHYISYLQKDGTDKFMKINKSLIKEGIRIRVRQGSTIIKDKATQAHEAMILWQNKAIDPVTLFEMLGNANPYKMAERYVTWTMAPQELMPDVYKKLEGRINSDREKDIRDSVLQAAIDEEALMAGEAVPGFKGVTNAHLMKHNQFLQSLEGQEIDPQILENIKIHMQEEQKMLQEKIARKSNGEQVTI